eukprot:m.66821 g.66821  ORF g.66821 m.66821 type:complete len:724 (-) comp8197_c0_seq1:524-2695(-)
MSIQASIHGVVWVLYDKDARASHRIDSDSAMVLEAVFKDPQGWNERAYLTHDPTNPIKSVTIVFHGMNFNASLTKEGIVLQRGREKYKLYRFQVYNEHGHYAWRVEGMCGSVRLEPGHEMKLENAYHAIADDKAGDTNVEYIVGRHNYSVELTTAAVNGGATTFKQTNVGTNTSRKINREYQPMVYISAVWCVESPRDLRRLDVGTSSNLERAYNLQHGQKYEEDRPDADEQQDVEYQADGCTYRCSVETMSQERTHGPNHVGTKCGIRRFVMHGYPLPGRGHLAFINEQGECEQVTNGVAIAELNEKFNSRAKVQFVNKGRSFIVDFNNGNLLTDIETGYTSTLHRFALFQDDTRVVWVYVIDKGMYRFNTDLNMELEIGMAFSGVHNSLFGNDKISIDYKNMEATVESTPRFIRGKKHVSILKLARLGNPQDLPKQTQRMPPSAPADVFDHESSSDEVDDPPYVDDPYYSHEGGSTVDQLPPYWLASTQRGMQGVKKFNLVVVSPKFSAILQRLLNHTGLFKNAPFTSFHVKSVERNENVDTWKDYQLYRFAIADQLRCEARLLQPRIPSLPFFQSLPSSPSRADLLRIQGTAANEQWLFTRVSAKDLDNVLQHGTLRKRGEVGSGLYFVESSTDAHNMVDDNMVDDDENIILLCRVVLGNVFEVPNVDKRQFAGNQSPPGGHESVAVIPSSDDKDEMKRTFVTYEKISFYPEYIIRYEVI